MRNTSQQNSSYAAAQKLILDKESKKKNNATLRCNFKKGVFYLIALFFLIWIYYKWQKIPVRNHAFRAEYIASADSSSRLRAIIHIVDPKVLDIDSLYYTESNNHNTIRYRDYHEHYEVSIAWAKKEATPKYPNSWGHVSEYIGSPLYNELSNSCNVNNAKIDWFSDVFYFEHLDNEKAYYKKYRIDTLRVRDNGIFMVEKNNFFSIDSNNVNSLDLYHFNLANTSIKETITNSCSSYNNITQSLVLIPPFNRGYLPESFYKLQIPSRFWRFITSMITLEDISQSYYNIKLSSNTIPEILLKMNFIGSIDCNFTKNQSINYFDTPRTDINIGRNFIEFLKTNKGNTEMLVLVKFNDMQNMQTTRLFIIGVLITLTLTKLFGVVWSIIRIPIIKVLSRIKRFIYNMFHKKKEASDYQKLIEEISKDAKDDIPGFWL